MADNALADRALDGQALFDEITGAVLAGDWEAYRGRTALPFVVVSPPGTLLLDSEDKLRRNFEWTVEMYANLKVTDVYRRVRDQILIGSYMAAIRFETHVLTGATRLCDPYPNEAIVRFEDGRWKSAMVACSLLNEEWPLSVPKPERIA